MLKQEIAARKFSVPDLAHDAERWLEAVVTISRKIANLEETIVILEAIVGLARTLMSADVAAIALLNESSGQLILKCHATEDGIQQISCDKINETVVLRAVQNGQAIRFPDEYGVGTDLGWYCPTLEKPIQSAGIVPVMLDGTPVGALWVSRYEAIPFELNSFLRLPQLADQVVITLEHASMMSKLQAAAVAQERYRIAREMHDSLAQVLGYLSLQMQTLEVLVKQRNQDGLLAELSTARKTINAAQDDVRESILSLRTTLSDDLLLLTALEQYVEAFGIQTGIDVQFTNEVQEPVHLSPLAETELVRIVQEALTNIRKHAQAHHVQMCVTSDHQRLHIHIADDGIGMSTQEVIGSHFGLQTMHERAQAIHGELSIVSELGQGTTVTLSVPLLASSRNK
jgi:signal transduction histidine kinase